MGRKTWATDEEHLWLVGRIPAYRNARQIRKLGDFYSETYAGFFQAFPLHSNDPVGVGEVAVGGDKGRVGSDAELAVDRKLTRTVRMHPPIDNE